MIIKTVFHGIRRLNETWLHYEVHIKLLVDIGSHLLLPAASIIDGVEKKKPLFMKHVKILMHAPNRIKATEIPLPVFSQLCRQAIKGALLLQLAKCVTPCKMYA